MGNSYFRFKQFMVHQDACGMKISTDAVLLGALASHQVAERVLDIGTGTGVVALMMAQRFPYSAIQGMEIDNDAFLQASDNVAISPWKDRITLFQQSFQEYATMNQEGFDLIVSNPPYFPDHIKSQNHQRNLALHNDALPFPELVNGAVSLLAPKGLLWVILPERQMQDLEKLATHQGLFPYTRIAVRNHPSAPVFRVVQAFSYVKQEPTENTLTIRDQESNYSMGYKKLLRDFMLNF
jgi:tRNA1Val (adenine37-N6)-methyltransferase